MIRRAILPILIGTATLCSCSARQGGKNSSGALATKEFVAIQSYSVPHERLFSLAASALEAEGFAIETRDSAATRGFLLTAPRFAPPRCLKPEIAAAAAHLGVVLAVGTRVKEDSTEVRVMAETRLPSAAVVAGHRVEDLDFLLRTCGTFMLLSRLDSLTGRASRRASPP